MYLSQLQKLTEWQRARQLLIAVLGLDLLDCPFVEHLLACCTCCITRGGYPPTVAMLGCAPGVCSHSSCLHGWPELSGPRTEGESHTAAGEPFRLRLDSVEAVYGM